MSQRITDHEEAVGAVLAQLEDLELAARIAVLMDAIASVRQMATTTEEGPA